MHMKYKNISFNVVQGRLAPSHQLDRRHYPETELGTFACMVRLA